VDDDPLNAAWSHQWRVDPCGVLAIERACVQEPRLRDVMKWYDEQHRYVRCQLMVCTEPRLNRDLQVFGVFVLDVNEYAARKDRPVEQDFLVRSKRGASPTVYYSGVPRHHPLAASGFWQDMTAFCSRVGTNGDYGCHPVNKGLWQTPDHWLPISAPLFDSKPELRVEVTKAVERARLIIELRAMGAMEAAQKPEKRPGS
jgi:hypothetical protein